MTPEVRRKPASPPAVVIEPVMLSPVMRAFDRVLRAVATKDVIVTLVGESGSGKEVMARRLRSGRTVRAQDLPPTIRRSDGEPRARDEVTVSLDRPLAEIVEQLVDEVIAAERGNLTRAAERLGVSVRTLQRRGPRLDTATSGRPATGARAVVAC